MSKYKANPLFATLVVVMTLLLCAEAGDGPAAGGPESCSEVGDGPAAGRSESCGEVGDRPKPATVLLQKRNEKLKVEDTGMANGTRLTDDGPYERSFKCPRQDIIVKGKCQQYAQQLNFQYDKLVGFDGRRSPESPPGCFLFKGRLYYNSNMQGLGTQSGVKAICATSFNTDNQRIYLQRAGSCPQGHRITTQADCVEKADILVVEGKLKYNQVLSMPQWENNFPAGCFRIKRTLWFNENDKSTETCAGVRGCKYSICVEPNAD